MEAEKGGYKRRRLCGGHKARRQATEQRWRWCEAIKKGRVCFVCPWCTHQGLITRLYWSDELRAVISLLRLHSSSRSISSVMLLSTPSSAVINPAAKTADTITRKCTHSCTRTCWAPHRQIPGKVDWAPARSGIYKNVTPTKRDAHSNVIGTPLPCFLVWLWSKVEVERIWKHG